MNFAYLKTWACWRRFEIFSVYLNQTEEIEEKNLMDACDFHFKIQICLNRQSLFPHKICNQKYPKICFVFQCDSSAFLDIGPRNVSEETRIFKQLNSMLHLCRKFVNYYDG